MSRARILGGLVLGAVAAFGVSAYATETHPSELFKQYCAKCHGDDGKADTARGRQLKARNFTDAEWQSLQKAFPSGVCDYSKPGVDQRPTIPWLTYQDGSGKVIYGGRPMGPAPVSRPFGPGS